MLVSLSKEGQCVPWFLPNAVSILGFLCCIKQTKTKLHSSHLFLQFLHFKYSEVWGIKPATNETVELR